jgi:hypothetical protein
MGVRPNSCVSEGKCNSLLLRITDPDNSERSVSFVRNSDGTYSSKGYKNKSVIRIEKNGDYTRTFFDSEKNKFVENLGKRINRIKSLTINDKEIKHGGLIVRSNGKEGKMDVVDKENITEYIKKNGIKNAIVSTNGVNNTGTDAVGMLRTVTSVTGNKNAFHLYNDAQVFEGKDKDSKLGSLGNRDKPTVQESLRNMIKAGAFSVGGSLICHSAGGNTCGISVLTADTPTNANVYTFGGVQNTSGNKFTNSWIDVYNSGDEIAEIGGVDRGRLDSKPPTPPKYDRDKKNYLLYNNSNSSTVIPTGNNPTKPNLEGWKTEGLVQHNFQNSYLPAFQQLYQNNLGVKK